VDAGARRRAPDIRIDCKAIARMFLRRSLKVDKSGRARLEPRFRVEKADAGRFGRRRWEEEMIGKTL